MPPSDRHGLLLCDDLIFSSKITATAAAHGEQVRVARTVDELVRKVNAATAAVILELDHSDFHVAEVIARLSPRPRVIAYGSHVDAERLREARRAGCDLVLTRGQFVEQLEQELPHWLARAAG